MSSSLNLIALVNYYHFNREARERATNGYHEDEEEDARPDSPDYPYRNDSNRRRSHHKEVH